MHLSLRRPCFVTLALAAMFATACTVNPVTGKNELDLMGEAQEVQLGAQLYPGYTQMSLGEVPDRELQAYVESVGESLAKVGHRPQLDYHYNAVNDPEINAYALPGGKITITRGLLARLDSEDQLAAVLGHETGHVTARHAARQYSQAMILQAALVGAAVYMETQETKNRDVYVLGGLVGASLWMAHYSRNQERQSDQLGFQYMIEAGYNPRGMVEVMEVLDSAHDRTPNLLERMTASHPMTSERIENARQRLAGAPPEAVARQERVAPYGRRTATVKRTRGAYDKLAKARRLLAKEKTSEALPLLRDATREVPRDGLVRAFLATAELAEKRENDALRDADLAAKDPGSTDIFFVQMLTGQVYLANRRYGSALTRLDRAAELFPDQAQVEMMRGRALEGLGRRDEAKTAYRRVKQLAPDSELAKEADARLGRIR